MSWDGVTVPLREPAPKRGRPAERPVAPLLQRTILKLGFWEDMVLVEDGVLPVPVRVEQRQDEIRVPPLVSIFQDMLDFGIAEIWLDFQ